MRDFRDSLTVNVWRFMYYPVFTTTTYKTCRAIRGGEKRTHTNYLGNRCFCHSLAFPFALASPRSLIDVGSPLQSHRSPPSSFMTLGMPLTFQFPSFKGPASHLSWKDQGVPDLLQLFSILKIVKGFKHLLCPMITGDHLKRAATLPREASYLEPHDGFSEGQW